MGLISPMLTVIHRLTEPNATCVGSHCTHTGAADCFFSVLHTAEETHMHMPHAIVTRHNIEHQRGYREGFGSLWTFACKH